MSEWTPDRKVVAGAIAAVLAWGVQLLAPDLDVPPGIEAAFAVIVAYLIPSES